MGPAECPPLAAHRPALISFIVFPIAIRPVVSIGHDGHMADVIPVRTIGQAAGPDADRAILWEPGPAVVAEVTAAAAHLS